MNREEIEQQLKLSKKQNKEQRYDYLCSQFNCINYAIKLEKYTNKLQRENRELKKQLEEKENQQKEFIEYMEDKLSMCDDFLDTIKSDLEEVSYVGRASGKTYIATQIMKNETAKKCYEETLKKYKERIGVDME